MPLNDAPASSTRWCDYNEELASPGDHHPFVARDGTARGVVRGGDLAARCPADLRDSEIDRRLPPTDSGDDFRRDVSDASIP